MPSYLGCSLSFVGVAAVVRAQGGTSATVTGAVFVVGAALFVVGLAVQRFGARIIHAAMPPIVTGAVVMLIGFNLAPVTATTYWPQDQWTALLVMAFTGMAVVCLRGFWSRIAIFLGLYPKFGAVVAAIPGGVLGGITVILYGMIGLLGAQIWINAGVDLRNPLNLVPAAAGIIIGVGNVTLEFTDTFSLSGIALGTVVVIVGYHALHAFAPAHLKAGRPLLDEGTSSYDEASS